MAQCRASNRRWAVNSSSFFNRENAVNNKPVMISTRASSSVRFIGGWKNAAIPVRDSPKPNAGMEYW